MRRARPSMLVVVGLLLVTLVVSTAPSVAAQGQRPSGATIVFETAGPVVVGSRYDVVAAGFRPNT